MAEINAFRMPRYHEIPGVGLYLEQTVKYINESLAPLGCIEVTSSMISNYVKKRYIDRPDHKQYSAEQIARLFFIVLAKQVLSMEHIVTMFQLQRADYSVEETYNVFCDEFEAMLQYLFGLGKTPADAAADVPEEIRMLRSIIIAVSHMIYLNSEFDRIARGSEEVS